MTHKAKQRVSWWMNIFTQAITITVFVGTILYFPIKTRFEACERHEQELTVMFKTHCEEQKEKDYLLNKLQADLRVLNTLLERMNNELIDCRNSDNELRQRLYDFLSKTQP